MFERCYIRLLVSAISAAVMVSAASGQEQPSNDCPSNSVQIQQHNAKRTNTWKNLSPGQKFIKMKEWRVRLEQGLADLRKKRSDGTITEEEKNKLERMEQMLKRLDERLAAVTNAVKSSQDKNTLTTNTPAQNYEKQDNK